EPPVSLASRRPPTPPTGRRLRVGSPGSHEAPMSCRTRALSVACSALLVALAGCVSGPPRHVAAERADAAAAIAAAPSDWSRYDGTRIRITAPLVVSGNHRLDRDASVV